MNIADFIKGIGIFNLTSTRASDGALVDSNGDPIVPIDVTWAEFTALDPSDYNGIVIRISDKHGETGAGGSFVVGDGVANKWGQVSGAIDFGDYSSLPTASSYPGWEFITSNVGISGARWKVVLRNGSYKYVTRERCQLVDICIPTIYPPSGTITAGGVITLGTALPQTHANCWIYLPAGAVSGGSAGLYYATMSNATTAQVYTDYIDPDTTAFVPYIPSAPAAAVGSGGAYTTATGTPKSVMNFVVPAGVLGLNGKLCFDFNINESSSGNSTTTVNIGGTDILDTAAANKGIRWNFMLQNRGAQNSQIISLHNTGTASISTFGTEPQLSAIDFSTAKTVKMQSEMAAVTYWHIYQRVNCWFEVNS